jgi:hypothetical protein
LEKEEKIMCCVFTAMVLVGPRLAILVWYLINRARFYLAFDNWLMPLLLSIFLPWTMIMYMIVFPLGIVGLDWLWLGLGLVADIAWYAGGGFRRRLPGYRGKY